MKNNLKLKFILLYKLLKDKVILDRLIKRYLNMTEKED